MYRTTARRTRGAPGGRSFEWRAGSKVGRRSVDRRRVTFGVAPGLDFSNQGSGFHHVRVWKFDAERGSGGRAAANFRTRAGPLITLLFVFSTCSRPRGPAHGRCFERRRASTCGGARWTDRRAGSRSGPRSFDRSSAGLGGRSAVGRYARASPEGPDAVGRSPAERGSAALGPPTPWSAAARRPVDGRPSTGSVSGSPGDFLPSSGAIRDRLQRAPRAAHLTARRVSD